MLCLFYCVFLCRCVYEYGLVYLFLPGHAYMFLDMLVH